MNTGQQRFWKRWHTPKREETAQQSSRQSRTSTDKQENDSAGSESKSADRNELPVYAKDLKALLRTKLGLEERAESLKDELPPSKRNVECWQTLRETYLAMRSRERQEVEKKFDDYFTSRDDSKIDARPLAEAVRRERLICEAEMLTDSLYLVELLERRLANIDPGIMKNVGQAAMIRARDVRAILVEIFALKGRGIRDLAAHLDTVHRLAPPLCGRLSPT